MALTFNNLKFRPNNADNRCINATLELKPNIFLSVTAGPGRYSTPGGLGSDKSFDEYPDSNDFSSFEIATIDENLPDDQQIWDVKGWQSREDINNFINEYLKDE
tara:strand:- start:227 stop:538 length:312 start_codon:yes stop_codon:yes gene_type:complete